MTRTAFSTRLDGGDLQARTVSERAGPLGGPVHLIERGVVDRASDDAARLHERHGDRVAGIPVQERRRAVDGVDDPRALGRRVAPPRAGDAVDLVLLDQEGGVRVERRDGFHGLDARGDIGLAHQVDGGGLRVYRAGALCPCAHESARARRSLFRDLDVFGHGRQLLGDNLDDRPSVTRLRASAPMPKETVVLNRGLVEPLTPAIAERLAARARDARGAVLTATSVANSGHPGGSLSSMEIYTLLYSLARIRPGEPRWPGRDRIITSHGHTSPGVYASLAQAGFFPSEEFEAHFRQAGSVFEGHVERSVPGIEWSTGNLGQGLSAGVGMAIGARLTRADWHTFVAMSDGEQHKGQVAEARRVAVRRSLGQPHGRHRLQRDPDLGPHARRHARADRGRLARRRVGGLRM